MVTFKIPEPKEHKVHKSIGFPPSLIEQLSSVSKKYSISFGEPVRQCCTYALKELDDTE